MDVFVNEAVTIIRDVQQYCGLDLVQLHEDESPAFCDQLMPYVIKSLRIKDESSLQTSRAYQGKVRALLLDTYAREGVTGETTAFSEELAAYLRRCRKSTSLLLALGFGIKKKSDIDFLKGKADIAIIGSQMLQVVEQKGVAAVGDFIRSLC